MRKRRSKGRPTIADVAARAGVGAITVSRALRQPSQVSPALRKKIDAAVRDLDYVPDLNARALASRRTNLVAVLIPALTQNIFTDVLRGIYDGVEDSGLRIEIANTRYDREIEERAVAAILRHAPAGVVVSGVDQSAVTRKMLEAAGCPVVQIMDLTDDPIQKIIGFSHVAAGRRMTEHLIACGYRRIGFLAAWMNTRSRGRMAGWRLALEEAGLYDPDLLGMAGPSEPDARPGPVAHDEFATARMGRELTLAMLDRRPDLDAVFCNTDVLAIGALFACNARGVAVPRDFGIAGFNDFDYMEAAHPSLSSVRIHRWHCGNAAMRAIRDQLAGGELGDPVVDLGFDVMKRASTERPADTAAAGGPGRRLAVPGDSG
jgi:LacI family transcriptional regulator, gluconate utilization system Gnt-I transcriptional repressor